VPARASHHRAPGLHVKGRRSSSCLAALALCTAMLSGCSSTEQGQAGRAKVVQVVVTSPATPTPKPASPAPSSAASASPSAAPRQAGQAYSPPPPPQTLSAAQVQATREAFEASIASADDKLRHTVPYSTPTATSTFQPPR